MNIFEKAIIRKFRYHSNKGQLNTEDLFDLSLEELDEIAKFISSRIREMDEESFIGKRSSSSVEFSDKLEILKSVIAYKLKLKEDALEMAARIERKQRLLEAIEAKENEKLKEMSLEDLKNELKSL